MFYFVDHRCLTWVLTVFFHCLELTLPASTEVASHPGRTEQRQLAAVQGDVIKEDAATDGTSTENVTSGGLAVESELLPVAAVDSQVAVVSQVTKSTTSLGDNHCGEENYCLLCMIYGKKKHTGYTILCVFMHFNELSLVFKLFRI